MKNKKVLTSILAGVMALSAIGATGCGDKNTNSNADSKTSSNAEAKKESKKLSFKEISTKIQNKSQEFKKALKGDLDFAYDEDAKITIDKSLTGDNEIKPINISISAKQKGKTTGVDTGIKYDDKAVATLKTIIDRESKNVYAQVPELSEGYMYLNASDAKATLDAALQNNEQAKQMLDSFSSLFSDLQKDSKETNYNFDLKGYADEFKNALPKSKDADSVKGDVDGVKYELSTKSVEIGNEDFEKVLKAVLEKAKTDENFKNVYDKYVSKLVSAGMKTTGTNGTIESEDGQTAATAPSFEELINQLEASIKTGESNPNEKVVLDLYYNDKEFAGFKATPTEDKDQYVKFISFETEDAVAIDVDMNIKDNDKTQKMTVNGAIKAENNTLNGTIKFNSNVDDEKVSGTYKVDNFKADDDSVSGKIKVDATVDGKTVYANIDMDSKKDQSKMTYDIGQDKTSLVKLEYNLKKTEASDISIPKENTYNVLDQTQLQQFQTSIDMNKFTENLKNALGEELYNKIMSGATSSASGNSSLVNSEAGANA